MKRLFLLFLSFSFSLLGVDECPAMLEKSEESKRFGEMRLKSIQGWDTMLSWALSPKNRSYQLVQPPNQKHYTVTSKALFDFARNYGYFSIHHPIVGIVTDSARDIEVTQCLLEAIHEEVQDSEQRLFSTQEILSKVMAYRSLRTGQKISFSTQDRSGNSIYAPFVVDAVIDLWHGMPGFGLVPVDNEEIAPILLFRGTDLSLTSEKGWASILSDLDVTGPGHTTYLKAKELIHEWLLKMQRRGLPARVQGFSLGGVFVLYTMTYFPELLNKEAPFPSIAYNPPGVSKEILDKWKELPIDLHIPHRTYVDEGDFVSQIGYFFSDVWEITLSEPMKVIEAHGTLISTQPSFTLSQVDVQKENASRD